MNSAMYPNEESDSAKEDEREARDENRFKKLKRPEHASKRSRTPERLRGLHRRRRKRMDW